MIEVNFITYLESAVSLLIYFEVHRNLICWKEGKNSRITLAQIVQNRF